MGDCEKTPVCPFFNDKLANMPSVADLMKREFCHGDKGSCARYRVSCAKIPVPPDLFPNDSDRAFELCNARAHKK